MRKDKLKKGICNAVTINTKKIFFITGILFSVIGIAVIVGLLCFTLKVADVKPDKSPTEINAKNALELFKTKTQLTNNWFTNICEMPDSILSISTEMQTLILKTINNSKADTICHYSNGINSHIKSVKDTTKFDSFVEKSFSISTQNIAGVDFDVLTDSLNAKSDYSAEIKKTTSLPKRDVIFSLLYNKIVGGQKGQVAITIKNKKLNVLKSTDIKCTQIDLAQLAENMKNVYENDSLSAQDKYVITRYQEKFSSKRNANNNAVKDTLIQKVVAFLGNENAIAFAQKLPFEFVYLNFRKDKLYIGDSVYSVTKDKVGSLDNNVKTIYDDVIKNPERIYYTYQNTLKTLPELPQNDSLQWGTINRDILSKAQLTNNDVAQNYVLVPNSSKNLIWIAIGLVLLIIGLVWWVLWLYFKNSKKSEKIICDRGTGEESKWKDSVPDSSLDSFLKPVRENPNSKMAIVQLITLYDNYFIKQKDSQFIPLTPTFEEYKKLDLFWTTPNDTIEKVLKTYDAIFITHKSTELLNKLEETKKSAISETTKKILKEISGQTIPDNEIEKIIQDLKDKRQFYDKLIANKNNKEKLFELLEKGLNISKIDSYVQEWFREIKEKAQTESQKKNLDINDLIISGMLNSQDAKLERHFNSYKIQTEEYNKCNSLLADKPQSFYTYLRDKVETLADTSDIEKFVDFGSLFKPNSNKSIQGKDAILLTYKQTEDIIRKFVSEYNRNKEINSVTLKSMSIGISSVSNMVFPLLKIWNKIPLKFENDAKETVRIIQQELLENLGTKLLNNVYYQNKIQDFDKEKATLQALIDNFNRINHAYPLAIDEKHWQTLADWSAKIRKSNDSRLFVDNMYKYFVSDFVNNAKKINPDSPEDKAWFFEKLFNIVFHTADYVEYSKREKIPITQFDNYVLLCNYLDFTKTPHKEYQHNHVGKSTRFSNAIYELAIALNIKELKILIDNYQIKL